MEKWYNISCPSCGHKMEAEKSIAQKEGILPLGWARCTRCNSGMRLVYDDVTDTMRVELAELEGE